MFLFSPVSFSWVSEPERVLYTEAIATDGCCGSWQWDGRVWTKKFEKIDAERFSATR